MGMNNTLYKTFCLPESGQGLQGFIYLFLHSLIHWKAITHKYKFWNKSFHSIYKWNLT